MSPTCWHVLSWHDQTETKQAPIASVWRPCVTFQPWETNRTNQPVVFVNVSIWKEQTTDSNEASEVFHIAVDTPEAAFFLYFFKCCLLFIYLHSNFYKLCISRSEDTGLRWVLRVLNLWMGCVPLRMGLRKFVPLPLLSFLHMKKDHFLLFRVHNKASSQKSGPHQTLNLIVILSWLLAFIHVK